MSLQSVADEGSGQPDDDAPQNLAATRTIGVAAEELAFVFGRYGLGIALCIFGISFAGFAVGLRDMNPGSFDLPILLTVFGFATVLLAFGVFVAILRKEGTQEAAPPPTKVTAGSPVSPSANQNQPIPPA